MRVTSNLAAIAFLVALPAAAEAQVHDLFSFRQEKAPAGDENSELAKKTQNPVADLISVPFQYNLGFNRFGDGEQHVLNIQPVAPFTLSSDWNLITRTIVPLIKEPDPIDEQGLGDINATFFFSPSKPSELIWGFGPAILLPTASKDDLGRDKYGVGPSAVVLTMQGPWVVGALANNIWSVGGSGDRRVNQMLLQPFINYNLPDGWSLSVAPIITADWNADLGTDVWTLPLGGGFGKVTRIGKLPVSLGYQAFYNVAHPDAGPDWSMRFQIAFLFPKL